MPDWVLVVVGAAVVFAAAYFLGRSSGPPPKRSASRPKRGAREEDEDEDEAPAPKRKSAGKASGPRKAPEPAPSAVPALVYDDVESDEEIDPTKVGMMRPKRPTLQPPTNVIICDEPAAQDEPDKANPFILVSATAQTDRGLRRKRNEDNLLVMVDKGVYAVADGMGGYAGGEIASELAVRSLEKAFASNEFEGEPHHGLPEKASELARGIQMANAAILDKAETDRKLEGMGTTICAARFSPAKQRLYVGHVGDSRLYRMRGGQLAQITSDHTMRDLGATGPNASLLSRAVGIWPTVPIDVILCQPEPGDIYLLCSDGLTKMVDDVGIGNAMRSNKAPTEIVEGLITKANEHGGKDNITVILISVQDARTSIPPR
jgi:protein phosphatase